MEDPRHGGSAGIYTKNRKIKGLSQTLIILSSVLLSDGGPFRISVEKQNNSLEKKSRIFAIFEIHNCPAYRKVTIYVKSVPYSQRPGVSLLLELPKKMLKSQ